MNPSASRPNTKSDKPRTAVDEETPLDAGSTHLFLIRDTVAVNKDEEGTPGDVAETISRISQAQREDLLNWEAKEES